MKGKNNPYHNSLILKREEQSSFSLTERQARNLIGVDTPFLSLILLKRLAKKNTPFYE